jgi:hypothetical protein
VVGGSTGITITLNSATATEVDIANVSEWAGVATSGALDATGTASANGSSGTSVSAGPITPTALGDLVVSSAYTGGGNTTQPTPGSGFSALAQTTVSTNYRGYGAYFIEPGNASISTTWVSPTSNRSWSSTIAAFLP